MPTPPESTHTLLREIVRALDDKKAENLQVLKVADQSSITDFLVIATGTSDPHLRALRIELEKVLDSHKAHIGGTDTGESGSGWTVVDAYQIMVHIFTPEKRETYRLEHLWKDAEELVVSDLLKPESSTEPISAPKKPRAKRPSPSTGAKKKKAPAKSKAPAAKKKTKTTRKKAE